MSNTDFTNQLQSLMQLVGISSFKALSRATGVSERQLLRLRRGEVEQIRVDVLLKLSQKLQISLSELVETFSSPDLEKKEIFRTQDTLSGDLTTGLKIELLNEIADLKVEYERSRHELSQQRSSLLSEFQQSSFGLLESLLTQFPTAAQKARENPQLEAVKILPLVEKPLEKLLLAWGIEAIASIGSEVPYDPALHQLMEGKSQLGEAVKVRYAGYRQGNKLLNRAKVSPV
ncbi:MAG: helix-turn-helix transcriptional regulator [Cyanomargarita calcarea GSE-NOS-MK-12-04C]|jgi:DNA-binding Xre family transcriptional regulator|uniref:Helix-turn-helix transcriptional regulator n=1 Tax=Cyanomargarita calcarea GSE-NOS-MK-12-04C TaxID=2839659 RepID=A0A951QIC6_9CYAN|nr:helix-turn-helix transcriptional regulator [Cyanomargarita calcarea GSE-NOS-MK-12-04C]